MRSAEAKAAKKKKFRNFDQEKGGGFTVQYYVIPELLFYCSGQHHEDEEMTRRLASGVHLSGGVAAALDAPDSVASKMLHMVGVRCRCECGFWLPRSHKHVHG